MKRLIAIILILALAVPAVALMEENETDQIIGKWTFYWDTRPMNEEYNNGKPIMDFLVHSMDLYFFADNVAYMTMASMNKSGNFRQEYPAMDGVWMKTKDNEYTANFHGTTYKISFDGSGRLLLPMTDKVSYPFVKTPFYDYMSESK